MNLLLKKQRAERFGYEVHFTEAEQILFRKKRFEEGAPAVTYAGVEEVVQEDDQEEKEEEQGEADQEEAAPEEAAQIEAVPDAPSATDQLTESGAVDGTEETSQEPAKQEGDSVQGNASAVPDEETGKAPDAEEEEEQVTTTSKRGGATKRGKAKRGKK